jgi:dienelactone hydrolase
VIAATLAACASGGEAGADNGEFGSEDGDLGDEGPGLNDDVTGTGGAPGAELSDDPGGAAGTGDGSGADWENGGSPTPGVPAGAARTDIRCTYGSVPDPYSLAEMQDSGPYEVGTKNVTFTDPNRVTPANGSFAGSDVRRLDTTIWYPGGAKPLLGLLGPHPVAEDGPFPLIVYSHGFSSSRDEGATLGEHLASHGYIVIAPSFPLSSWNARGGPTLDDIADQPKDQSFLIDQMEAKSLLASDHFYGSVDVDRVGAAGVSMGGMTTSLLTFHATLHDSRIKAAATVAGPASMFSEEFYDHRAIPILGLHGDIDAIVNYDTNARRLLERAAPYSNLLTIEGASHTAFAPIPLEALVLPIFGSLVAPEGSHSANPDRLGCGVIADSLPDSTDFLRNLGGPQNGLTDSDDPMPCGMEFLSQPAIDPEEQRRVAVRAVLSFFQAYLGPDADTRERSCHYLYEELPGEPGLTLE